MVEEQPRAIERDPDGGAIPAPPEALAAEVRRLREALRDIRRYCGDRGSYLGWVARRIDVEGRFR